jgi:thiol-disulfide isomerase/thioredoxin
MKTRTALVAASALVALVVAFVFTTNLKPPEGQAGIPKLSAGKNLAVFTRDGKKVDLSTLQGRIVLVHFWATWCPPCVDELPELDRFWQRYRNNPSIALYSVSVDDSWEAIDAFRKEHPFDLPLFRDPQSKTAHKFGTTKFPETYIADRNGKVLYHLANAIDWDSSQVTDNIDALLKQE